MVISGDFPSCIPHRCCADIVPENTEFAPHEHALRGINSPRFAEIELRRLANHKHPNTPAGRKAAQEGWELFLASIKLENEASFDNWEYVQFKRLQAKYASLEGDDVKADLIESQIKALQDPRTRDNALTEQVFNEFPYADDVVRKVEQVKKHEEWSGAIATPEEQTLTATMLRFTDKKKTEISYKEWNAITNRLEYFRLWLEDLNIDNPARVGLHNHLRYALPWQQVANANNTKAE
jgi:hypothetical protein